MHQNQTVGKQKDELLPKMWLPNHQCFDLERAIKELKCYGRAQKAANQKYFGAAEHTVPHAVV